MKKYFKLIITLLFICILSGCGLTGPEYINSKNKPTPYFYTEEIYSKLTKKEHYTLKIFDLNIYKYYDVNPEEHSIVLEFIECLKKESYNTNIDAGINPRYKLIIEFDDAKYVINAFNDKQISINPWDGIYEPDYISMDGIPDYYNLYKFCDYIEKISRGFEG
ncbi:DUF4883 family protein [Clostridium septicum]|uniref:DUF4883 family protein n=1 Tax=Clostridium septicum TaxID=1504 RepID=A0A9N7JMY1_CLOSE|nr:DUF4883 family protein [Clostridium septicum]AYE35373.1 hypothetical protein CP523_13565 [Clostridium septicum]MDU1315235.1 DUF4883 family protein [Clostridium septicum]QAS60763.1 hypothetical protein EI377_08460 [Clostridium septicum]UEC19972.1 DUF4883 family protein [Clostridium septicum]USS01969.1 DUF4883 family protein [Clostridium septicum]